MMLDTWGEQGGHVAASAVITLGCQLRWIRVVEHGEEAVPAASAGIRDRKWEKATAYSTDDKSCFPWNQSLTGVHPCKPFILSYP